MNRSNALSSPASVLRNVTMQELPHSLARPRAANGQRQALDALTAAIPATPMAVALQAGSFDEGYAAGHVEGLSEGVAAGRAAQLAECEGWLQEEAEKARREAAEEGHAEGMRRATVELEQAAEQLQMKLRSEAEVTLAYQSQRMEKIMQSLQTQDDAFVSQAEDDLVAMSHEVVCRILGERAISPLAIRGMVEHLLSQRAQQGIASLHLHPDDLAFLKGDAAVALEPAWQWVADDTVKLGGVVVRSAGGSLDARLETQLGALAKALLQARAQRRAGPQPVAARPEESR
jgi:flagellar assembly protein FliH